MNTAADPGTPPFGCTRHFLNPDDPIPAYRNQPLIGALGPIADEQTRKQVLSEKPYYHEGVCTQEPHLRAHAVRSLSDLFLAFPEHQRVMQESDIMMRRGYLGRNPLNPQYRRQVRSDLPLLKSGSLPPERFRSLPLLGAAYLGPPGSGKTTLFGKIMGQYPQVVHHGYEIDGTRFAFTQVVYLTINLFQDASLKAFAIEFFERLGAALQQPGLRGYWGVDRCNGNTAQPLIYQAAREYNLGMLVIDDSQNMVANNRGYEAVLNYFVRMMNCLGLPTVLIGTNRTEKMLAADATFGRRFSGTFPKILPLRPKREGQPDGRWELFLKEVWGYRFVRTSSDWRPQSQLVYDLTGGIPDLVIKLYTLAQTRCFGRKREEVTGDVLRETAAELCSLVQGRLAELKGLCPDTPGIEQTKNKLDEAFKDRVNANLARVGADPAFDVGPVPADLTQPPAPAATQLPAPDSESAVAAAALPPLIAASKEADFKSALAAAGLLEKIR